MGKKLESAPAMRLKEKLGVSVGRVSREVEGWTGRPALLGLEAQALLEELDARVSALCEAMKRETLAEQLAQEQARRCGVRAGAVVRRFHAHAHGWMWEQRSSSETGWLEPGPNEPNFALRQWLQGVNPSSFDRMDSQDKADFLDAISARAGELLGSSEQDVMLGLALFDAAEELERVAQVLAEARSRAAAARRHLAEALEGELASTYQAAQDVWSGALRLRGQHDRLTWFIPSYWHTVSPSKRGARGSAT